MKGISGELPQNIYQGGFSVRVCGVLLHQNRILLSSDEKVAFWALPGGGVKLFESSEQALIREFKEELNLEIKVVRLLYIIENSFEFQGMLFHGFDLTFLISVDPWDPRLDQKEISGIEDDFDPIGGIYAGIDTLQMHYKWFDFTELDQISIKPKVYHQALTEIPEHPRLFRNLEIRGQDLSGQE